MRGLVLLFVGVMAVGCDDPKTLTPVPAGDSAVAEANPVSPDNSPESSEPREPDPEPGDLSPDEPSTQLPDFPTSLDLEKEAERTVAPENLEAELDRLEAEIVGFPD